MMLKFGIFSFFFKQKKKWLSTDFIHDRVTRENISHMLPHRFTQSVSQLYPKRL